MADQAQGAAAAYNTIVKNASANGLNLMRTASQVTESRDGERKRRPSVSSSSSRRPTKQEVAEEKEAAKDARLSTYAAKYSEYTIQDLLLRYNRYRDDFSTEEVIVSRDYAWKTLTVADKRETVIEELSYIDSLLDAGMRLRPVLENVVFKAVERAAARTEPRVNGITDHVLGRIAADPSLSLQYKRMLLDVEFTQAGRALTSGSLIAWVVNVGTIADEYIRSQPEVDEEVEQEVAKAMGANPKVAAIMQQLEARGMTTSAPAFKPATPQATTEGAGLG